ncbi:transcription termination factor 4, mitochondrial [Sorex araneus]|uniref:transcription termination factor 4, mitochondrial n=1 Tax=Sorex araneus TaxID=42254 RepID=UPI0024335405|nr:transcription termination factor 4, mitochondrial [Sorex araneus]
MAALARQACGWPRLLARPWACGARLAPGERRRTTAASSRRPRLEPPRDEPRVQAQESQGGLEFSQHRLEEQGASAGPASPGLGLFSRALLDMGFSEDHAKELLGLRPGSHPRQLLDIVSELILLGVNPEPVFVALKTNPQLLKLPVAQVRKRCGHLRKLGLGEGKMKRVLLCCPDILTMHQRDLEAILEVLKDKCLFTVQQVTEILHRCPYVLREDPDELEYKFQYAYFRMGVAHADIVTSGFLQYSITKIKQRHVFLERLGRYQTPDKKGQTQVPNPLLKDILRVSEAEFLARTACSSAEEFDVFKKLLAREEEEPEGRMPKDRSDSLDEDEEEEEE